MKQELKSVKPVPNRGPGRVGDWVACLIVWCTATAMCVAIVVALLNPTQ